MKKNYLFTILFSLMCILPSWGQTKPEDPIFSAVTNKSVGEFIQIYLTSTDYFWIDWGDGYAKRYEKGAYGEDNPLYPTSGLKGNEIKIYGDDVTYLIAYDCGFTKADAMLTNQKFWLELSRNPLESLNVDECFLLGTLIVEDCELTELNLGTKKKLETLDVSGNKLKTIDFSKCKELVNIDLSSNKISGDFVLPSKLVDFAANDNAITGLECAGCTETMYFSARNNKINSIDLSDMPALVMCDISGNELTDIKFEGKYNYITNLAFHHNKLESIDLSLLSDLHALDLSDNMFGNIDVSKNPEITSLKLDNNNLSEINLSNNSKINFLHINGNKLKTLDINADVNLFDLRADDNMLENVIMPDAPGLICVMLRNNNLSAQVINDMIQKLPDVNDAYIYSWEKDWKQHLNLSGNAEAVYADLSKAVEKGWILDVEQQDKPVEMKGFDMTLGYKSCYVFKVYAPKGTNIQIVNTNGEVLAEEKTDDTFERAEIWLWEYPGDIFDDSCKVRIQSEGEITGLGASSQGIRSIVFADCVKINRLDLSSNELVNLDITKLTELEDFNVSNNQIKELDFSNCNKLKNVDIDGNQLSELNLNTDNVIHLHCYGNKLSMAQLPDGYNMEDFVYAPQNPFEVEYDNSGVLDLSDMYERCGVFDTPSYSTFYVIKEDGSYCVNTVDYTVDKGVISFLKPLDNVRVCVESDAYPALIGESASVSELFNVSVAVGIDNIVTDGENVTVYDLTGRKIESPTTKGIYIVNGRKVVIK